jgi:FixJ family two-component response regulator
VVYLIDNDKSVRRGFEIFLKSAGMEIITTDSIEDFLTHYFPGKNDLLVLDLSFPGTKGTELLLTLRNAGINVPVIVITSSDDSASRDICIQYDVKAYLRKPVDSEALLDIIKFNLQSQNLN